MSRNIGPAPETTGSVHLTVATRGQFGMALAPSALEQLDWLGEPLEFKAGHPGSRRVRSVLALPITDGSSPGPIGKGALIDVGPVAPLDEVIQVAISWQSDSITPLFPVFAGRLSISPELLVLDGEYAPPLGRLGLLIDERLLHFVARRTAQALLARFARRLDGSLEE